MTPLTADEVETMKEDAEWSVSKHSLFCSPYAKDLLRLIEEREAQKKGY